MIRCNGGRVAAGMLLVASCWLPAPLPAADAAAGREAASQCSVCHGRNGIATVPDAPNLAGESAIYIEKQLMAFKRGERQHRQMSLIATALDDNTIRDLAAWFESMQVTVVVPEQD